MGDIAENQTDGTVGFDPRIQTEDIGFKPEEMQPCTACGRMNPPNRPKCLYCANELEIKAANAALVKPNFRKIEPWERGFNVIIRNPVAANQALIANAAPFLSINPEDLSEILDAADALPLARVESEIEANILVTGLALLGLECFIVADTDLMDDKLPVRLCNIEFSEKSIAVTDFNTRKVTDIDAADLALLVPGMLTTSKVDSLEKKGRRGKTKVIDETATASDESILDIYTRHDPIGFRVHLTGFDFSCLGADKGILAVENMRRLAVTLKERVPNAKLVGDYQKARHSLGHVWEIEARKDSQGLQRSGFGKVEFGSIASTSNLRQFTKYSRLQWHLL